MTEKLLLFKKWFLDGGGHFGDHVELQYDGQRNLHLRVADGQRLEAGSCVVSCPHALTLSHLNVRRGKCEAISVFSLNLLRFFLIEQYHLGEQSFWWPYIRILPDPLSEYPFDTPLYYNDDDLKWIQGTSLEHSRRNMEAMWREEHAHGLQNLLPSDRSHYPWKLYKWAATVLSSRSFPSSALLSADRARDEDTNNVTPVLLPGLDLLNHSPNAKVTWQWTSEACYISTHESLAGGTEIFNNYAPKSNEELILGYGFSLFMNPSDHCNIALGPVAVARIEQVLLGQRAVSEKASGADGSATIESTTSTAVNHRITGVGWVRLLPTVPSGTDINMVQPPHAFSESFLEHASMAFFNTRETMTEEPIADANLCSSTLTRNKLHTICATAMIFQKQNVAITVNDYYLPPWPMDQRQLCAARYRRRQITTLHTVSCSIVADLRRLTGLDRTWSRDKRIMRLEHILKAGPKEFLTDFRAALHVGLGTRDAVKIRQQRLSESAFTVWLCGLWLWTLPGSDSDGSTSGRPPLPARTAAWVDFARATYDEGSSIGSQWSHPPTTTSEEGRLLAESYHSIVQAAAAKHQQSVYNHPEATAARLLWCLRVIREESFMSPSLDGEAGDEDDELMLFLEDGMSIADRMPISNAVVF
ncbi:MAG: hypothetical protein L6R35_004872 [Caloplaca aegaea]|nr:MAG: hypothetical protein L6R35_004872 [Caloplaca aegaea]